MTAWTHSKIQLGGSFRWPGTHTPELASILWMNKLSIFTNYRGKKVPYRWSKLTTLENKKVSSAALEMRYWDLLVYLLGIRDWDLQRRNVLNKILKSCLILERYLFQCLPFTITMCKFYFILELFHFWSIYKQLWQAMNSWLVMATHCAWSVGCVRQIQNAYNFGHLTGILRDAQCALINPYSTCCKCVTLDDPEH